MFHILLRGCRMYNIKSICIPKAHIFPRICYTLTTQFHRTGSLCNKSEKSNPLRDYVVNTVVKYINLYEAMLQRRFPKIYYYYHIFFRGLQSFYNDIRTYFDIIRMLTFQGKTLGNLTRSQLELYEQMPKDIRQVGPLLFVSMFPFIYYFTFPLMYFYPRRLLTRHFWTLNQAYRFSLMNLRLRLVHNEPLFKFLKQKVKAVDDTALHIKWSNIIQLLEKGQHPSPEQILECKELFSYCPYNITYLADSHLKHLAKMHEVYINWYKRESLIKKGVILKAMDDAILREGGVEKLSEAALKNACFIRGLNPVHMADRDCYTWLSQWIAVSRAVDQRSASLLLHCPILLGYNQPSNLELLHSDEYKPSCR